MRNHFSKAGTLASALLMSAILFTACESNNRTADRDNDVAYNEYRGYVVSVRDTSDRYYERDWNDIEREYNQRRARVEERSDRMDDRSRAEYRQLEADWEAFRDRYNERRTRRESEGRVNNLRGTLMSTPSDATFGYVAGSNIREAYERFIETVRANNTNYTTQDWNEVNSLYNALKARRQAVQSEIPSGDRMRIQNLELEFETKMLVNKPFSPSEQEANRR